MQRSTRQREVVATASWSPPDTSSRLVTPLQAAAATPSLPLARGPGEGRTLSAKERGRVMAQVIVDETGDEVIAVIVTRMQA